jgi:excinuclease ABC subunit C
MLPAHVLEKLEALPVQSGVYLFKDKKGTVVYVGKAKSLRSRVRSYFQAGGSDERYFIPILQRTVGDLETIVTANEKEATILENTLIKEYDPRYNVKLRDDKDFLCIRLDTTHEWPRLSVLRRRAVHNADGKGGGPDGARYFGPYHSATSARRTLHLVNKHFQLRTCSDAELERRSRPCLQYQIKRCPAPCVYEVDRSWYAEQVGLVGKFLDGRHDELSRELRMRMHEAATTLRFELAAVYRDQLRAIEKVREEQNVVSVDEVDRDVVGLYREADLVEVALLYVRGGKLADVATFSTKQAEIPDEEILAAFLSRNYEGALTAIPPEIILPLEPDAMVGIEEWITDQAGHKVALLHPKRGPRVDLLALANDNAKHAFREKRRQKDDIDERLAQLQERLRLPVLPRRIEGCDISHLGGGDTVGAIVAMKDGLPDKKRYRTFHVRGTGTTLRGGDDYGAMYEVLGRRFRRSLGAKQAKDAIESHASLIPPSPLLPHGEKGEIVGREEPQTPPLPSWERGPGGEGRMTEAEAEATRDRIEWDLPDLFVVDGGRGQLAVALAAAHDLGLHDLPIVGLAKEKENVLGETLVDRVYLPGQKNPIPLRSHSASLFFLARLRDEAHRFSNRARERLGKARRLRSELDGVPGIGPATKKALLEHLGTVAAIKRASNEALAAVPGVNARHVAALRQAFPEVAPPEDPGT